MMQKYFHPNFPTYFNTYNILCGDICVLLLSVTSVNLLKSYIKKIVFFFLRKPKTICNEMRWNEEENIFLFQQNKCLENCYKQKKNL